MKANQCEIEVRFSEIDSMMIAHNSKYYVWFEIGRFQYSRTVLGLDKSSLLDDYRLPVVRSSCKYIAPIHFGDVLMLNTFMCPTSSGKIKFYYYLYNQDNRLCAIGSTVHVMLTGEGKIVLKYDEQLQGIFAKAMQEHGDCFVKEEDIQKIEVRINR